ncbi:hypothetical protein FRC12_006501 [Ceratobasidium sp. 428]|nr:hypothetical protein FRC12_006501 [Ceratobasidium sp. 428]
MPTDEEKIPEVPLGTFAFSDQLYSSPKYDSDSDFSEDEDVYEDEYEYSNPKPKNGRTTDKPGEELSHEAAIWRIYRNEAQEYDQELVKSRHASLDMLLLFATLFSAVITAFLVESKNLLQQDPADASVALLLLIAQSQRRIELGSPGSPSDTGLEPNIPQFKASTTARWINGIWFTSLVLSISAALVAMLSKEWLNAFLISRPRHAHSHALDRQARLEGIKRWQTLYIIALLPSILHISLLLFSIGLVIYLWTLDWVIAIVLAVIVGATLLFYITTATLGAIFDYCPFVTGASRYIRRLRALMSKNSPMSETLLRVPTLKDIQALLWLADHARDPVAVDCSYQALAGLCKLTTASSEAAGGQNTSSTTLVDPHSALPFQLSNDVSVEMLLLTIHGRLKRLSSGLLDSVSNSEVSAARYLNAVLGILARTGRLSLLSHEGSASFQGQLSPPNVIASIRPDVSVFDLLQTIEMFWHNSSSTLSANAYACILVSTMDIIHHVTLVSENVQPTANEVKPPGQPGPERATHDGTHVVDFASAPPLQSMANTQVRILRAHYSQWLIRVSCILQLYSYGEVPIDLEVLNKLLHSMATAARCDILNPIDAISTHHPPILLPDCPAYTFVLHDNGRNYPLEIDKDDLHRGPLGALIELLRRHPAVKDGSPLKTCLATLKAYAALAPVILQQVLEIPRQELLDAFYMKNWEYAPETEMMGLRLIATRQVLLTVRFLGLARRHVRAHMTFCGNALGLLNLCLQLDGSYRFRQDTYWALAHYSNDFIPFLWFAGQSESNYKMITSSIKFELLNAARVRITSEGMTPCDNLVTPECFPVLIQMMEQGKNSAENIERLLQAMVRRMRANNSSTRRLDIPWNGVPAIDYVRQFTHTSKGFSALGYIGARSKYSKVVAPVIIDIVHLAAGRDPALRIEMVELNLEAAPGVLDAVSAALKQLWKKKDYEPTFVQLSTDVLTLLKVVVQDEAAKKSLRQHKSYRRFLAALRRMDKSDITLSSGIKKKIWSTLDSNSSPLVPMMFD